MPVTLRGLQSDPNSDTLGCVFGALFSAPSAIGAGIANTVVQALRVQPFNFKIRKIVVYVPSIDAVAGGDSFNLVVGTGAYAQGSIAPNDNFETTGVNAPTASLGNAVFSADVPFTAANAYNPNTGQGWITLTTGGGYGIFIPPNYDAVYSQAVPVTLRVSTVAGTGAIGAGLQVVAATVSVPLRRATAGNPNIAQTIILPGIDY